MCFKRIVLFKGVKKTKTKQMKLKAFFLNIWLESLSVLCKESSGCSLFILFAAVQTVELLYEENMKKYSGLCGRNLPVGPKQRCISVVFDINTCH